MFDTNFSPFPEKRLTVNQKYKKRKSNTFDDSDIQTSHSYLLKVSIELEIPLKKLLNSVKICKISQNC